MLALLLDKGNGYPSWKNLILGTGKSFTRFLVNSVESNAVPELTEHNRSCLIKLLSLPQTGANLLLSPESVPRMDT